MVNPLKAYNVITIIMAISQAITIKMSVDYREKSLVNGLKNHLDSKMCVKVKV